jgi:hypothetical protein
LEDLAIPIGDMELAQTQLTAADDLPSPNLKFSLEILDPTSHFKNNGFVPLVALESPAAPCWPALPRIRADRDRCWHL